MNESDQLYYSLNVSSESITDVGSNQSLHMPSDEDDVENSDTLDVTLPSTSTPRQRKRKRTLTMKEFMALHLNYPRSTKKPIVNKIYDNRCLCSHSDIFRRISRKCLLVDFKSRLLECNACGGIYKASIDEFELFKLYHKRLVYSRYSSKYSISDKGKYARITNT